ncbi:mannitol dehydrogenase family protein [Fretibacter rubidus]|uniref:mannitol dehydrogenase family protein n=1 Tax=Fretibacter rubidus TaxID=570162 RepID=UPI00352A2E23
MTRLSNQTLSTAKAAKPQYDRAAVKVGIVHLGPGAFHRAHQAVYTDDAMAVSGGDWGICGVSLNSRGMAEALSPQDGLYTLTLRDKSPSNRIIGSVKEVVCAKDDPDYVLAKLSHPDVSIVTMTITEKGYALLGNGHLDVDNAGIAKDVESPRNPSSAIGYLVEACRLRRAAAVPPLTLISCDNLPSNGDKLKTVVTEFAALIDGPLADYITGHVRFPNTMVDSITPATDDGVIEAVSVATGLHDAAPVQREAFSQWVIEDNLPEHRPDWEAAGATVTSDVHSFEMTKLRILNGAHSTLTYLGLLAGEVSVEDAISNPTLRDFVDALIPSETIPTIEAPKGLSLSGYWSQIIARFENPNIVHLLEQISHDGSQKIPARIFPVIEHHMNTGHVATRACFVVAAWIEFNRQRRAAGNPPTDGYLTHNITLLPSSELDAANYADAFLKIEAVIPKKLAEHADVRASIIHAAKAIADDGVINAAQSILNP